MPETAKALRDRIALFRRHLSEAVDADLTRDYLSKTQTQDTIKRLCERLTA